MNMKLLPRGRFCALLLLLGAALAPALHAQAPGPSSAYELGPLTMDLARGKIHPQVAILQRLLAADPELYPEGAVTGIFTLATERAVKRFQAIHELDSETDFGKVTGKTRTYLNALADQRTAAQFNAEVLARRTAFTRSPSATSHAALEAALRVRHQQMAALLRVNPKRAHVMALPAAIRESLPTNLRGLAEQMLRVNGAIEVTQTEYEEPEPFTLNVAHLTTSTGTTFQVTGDMGALLQRPYASVGGLALDGVLAVASQSAILEASPITTAATSAPLIAADVTATQQMKLAVIMVTFSAANPTTADLLRQRVTDMTQKMKDYYDQVSYGHWELVPTVLGVYALGAYIPPEENRCDSMKIVQKVQEVYGFDPSAFTHYMIVGARCAHSVASLGGRYSRIKNLNLITAIHELSHTLGGAHANRLSCGAVPLKTDPFGAGGCRSREYADSLDPLGHGHGHLNAAHKYIVTPWSCSAVEPPWCNFSNGPWPWNDAPTGMFSAQQLATVTKTGVFVLHPLETQAEDLKALRIPRPCTPDPTRTDSCNERYPWSNATSLWVEYRQSKPGGVLLYLLQRLSQRWGGSDTHLIHAGSGGLLGMCRTFTDPETGVKITPLRRDGTGDSSTLTVHVAFPPDAPPACSAIP